MGSVWSDLKEGLGAVVRGKVPKAEPKPKKKEEKKEMYNTGDLKGDLKKRGEELKKADPDKYKKGGMVKKTGQALVHKGERVLTKPQTKKLDSKPAVKKSLGIGKKR